MIYVTVGNHDQPFDRLIKEVDSIAQETGVKTFIQSGISRYNTNHASQVDFLPFSEAEEKIKSARVIVGHAGIGTVISARKWKKPLIITPRRKSFGEHINDHQLEICNELLENKRAGVTVAMETTEIKPLLLEMLDDGYEIDYTTESDNGAENLKRRIREFVNSI